LVADGQPTPERYGVIPPPLLFVVCLGAAGLVQFVKPIAIAPYSFPTGLIAGGVAILAGAALGIWGIWTLWMHRTPVEPGHMPSRVVTSGPFRFSRNPLYIALTTVALGIALMVNSAWFLAAAVVLVLLIDRIVVRREEAAIRRKFGAEYDAYVSRVRRWL
jgi:protein-S-isoprenylcysteine O-methyltransferase Ste14